MPTDTAARTIARWALALEPADVPEEVREAARRHILDGMGCAVAAVRLDAVPAAGAVARGFGSGDATVVGTADRIPAPMAALANGALVHGLDFDDTHAGALVHMTAAVLPAAFAVGEETGATGADVVTACVAGYEVVARLGSAVPHGLHARGFHATSVCGVFASALVASKLAGLGEPQTVNALGIAGSMAAGSLEFLHTGADTKQLHPGLAAMSGIMAARLAAEGAAGPDSILEGDYGLFRSYTTQGVDADVLTEGLGVRWETSRITVKPYPVCQLSHASLDALARALDDVSGPRRIAAIAFALPEAAVPIVCEPANDKLRPRTSYEAKFSLPWCAAALALDGRIDVGSFGVPELGRADIGAMAERVTHTTTDFAGPPADAGGAVTVRLDDGSSVSAEVPSSRGGPDNPLSTSEILDKFIANCGGASEGAERLASLILALDEQEAIRPVLETAASLRTTEGVR